MGPLIPWQVGNTALIVFVSYFGSRVHRPRLIGYGAVVVALAGLLMSLPHFISEPYRYDHTSPGKSRKGWAGDGREEPGTMHQGPLVRMGPASWGTCWSSPLPRSHSGWVPLEVLGVGLFWGKRVKPSGSLLVRACLCVTVFLRWGKLTTQPTLGPGMQ